MGELREKIKDILRVNIRPKSDPHPGELNLNKVMGGALAWGGLIAPYTAYKIGSGVLASAKQAAKDIPLLMRTDPALLSDEEALDYAGKALNLASLFLGQGGITAPAETAGVDVLGISKKYAIKGWRYELGKLISKQRNPKVISTMLDQNQRALAGLEALPEKMYKPLSIVVPVRAIRRGKTVTTGRFIAPYLSTRGKMLGSARVEVAVDDLLNDSAGTVGHEIAGHGSVYRLAEKYPEIHDLYVTTRNLRHSLSNKRRAYELSPEEALSEFAKSAVVNAVSRRELLPEHFDDVLVDLAKIWKNSEKIIDESGSDLMLNYKHLFRGKGMVKLYGE